MTQSIRVSSNDYLVMITSHVIMGVAPRPPAPIGMCRRHLRLGIDGREFSVLAETLSEKKMERATSMYKPVATWNTEDVVTWIQGEQYSLAQLLKLRRCAQFALCAVLSGSRARPI